jgi:hypothetical protein
VADPKAGPIVPKSGKPQVTPRALTTPTVGPVALPRKPFTRNLTVNIGQRKYLVVGGLGQRDADGHQPNVSAQIIAKRFGLNLNECLLCDPREIGKIEAGRAAGLKEYTVVDLNRKASQ